MSDILFETAAPQVCTQRSLLAGAPAVPRAEADLARLLGRGLRLALPGKAMEWLVLAPGGAQASGAGAWLALETCAGTLHLEDGARFIAGLSGIDGGGCDGAWPQWMAGAVAGRLAGTPLAGLQAVRPGAAPHGALVRLPWRLQEDGHAVQALAAATPQTWCALLAGIEAKALRMPWAHWLPLALDWPLALATHRLPLALYGTLASGDLILPDTAYFDCAGRGRVTLGRRRWHVAYAAPGRLELLNEEIPLPNDPFDDQAPQRAADAVEDDEAMPGAVSVLLRFELGRMRLTLDQLRALGPHSVLELLDGAPHAIAIVCSGVEVGRGEAVDVDGRLGVRITAWSGAC